MLETDNFINELFNMTRTYEYCENPLSDDELENTITNLSLKNCYILEFVSEKLVGYAEVWKVKPEQIGRIILNEPFDISIENITDGSICYIANLVLDTSYRRAKHLASLITKIYEKAIECDWFIWEQTKSKHAPLRIYSNCDFKRYCAKKDMEGVISHG